MGARIGGVVLDPRSSQNTLPVFRSQSLNHCGAAGRWAQSGRRTRRSSARTAEPPTGGRARVPGPPQVERTRGSSSQGVAGVKGGAEAALNPLGNPSVQFQRGADGGARDFHQNGLTNGKGTD